jgi:hypothetical protein
MNKTPQTSNNASLGLGIARRAASLLQELRIRRTGQSPLAREIAAYPAARGIGAVVLPR